MRNFTFIFCSILLIIFPTNAQEMLFKISLQEQIEQSSLVVEGKVIEKHAYFVLNNNRIITVNKIEILKNFKTPTAPNFIYVITKGGTIGDKFEMSKPSLQLKINDIGLFTLSKYTKNIKDFTSPDCYYTYSGPQGFYKYDEYSNTVSNPFYQFKDIKNDFYTTLTGITKKSAAVVKENSFAFEKQQKSLSAAAITNFSPNEVRAGTGETITITGTGFGNIPGIVSFQNADDGGRTWEDALPSAIRSWSDNTIIVRVPSSAGTGTVRVINGSSQFISNTILTVLSAESNAVFNFGTGVDTEYRIKLTDQNNDGGYTWSYNTSFFSNAPAVASWERAMQSWVCETGINWSISPNTTQINTTDGDNTNIIYFGNSATDPSEIGRGTLGVTTFYFSACNTNSGIISELFEMDMIFNSDVNWLFNSETPNRGEIDFETTALHELGHAHLLSHINDPGALMHFATGTGTSNRTIDVDSGIGAASVFSFSQTGSICRGSNRIQPLECPNLSLETDNIQTNTLPPVVIFKSGDRIEVSLNESDINLITVFAIDGRKITETKENSVSTASLSRGVYLLLIEDATRHTYAQKFIN